MTQLKPKEVKEVAFRLGDYYQDNDMLLDIDINLEYACYSISQLNNLFNNNILVTLTGLYESENLIANILKSKPLETFLDMKKNIPYVKTRTYIKKIIDSYVMYLFLYTWYQKII